MLPRRPRNTHRLWAVPRLRGRAVTSLSTASGAGGVRSSYRISILLSATDCHPSRAQRLRTGAFYIPAQHTEAAYQDAARLFVSRTALAPMATMCCSSGGGAHAPFGLSTRPGPYRQRGPPLSRRTSRALRRKRLGMSLSESAASGPGLRVTCQCHRSLPRRRGSG